MSPQIRFPNITATDGAGQLQQMRSFLHQLVEELNWAIGNAESSSSVYSASIPKHASAVSGSDSEAVTTFNSIKALIIKSADIVNAYYEQFNKRFSGEYVAKSDFGVFSEQTANDIEANSTAIEQFYANLQEIITDIETVEHTLIEVNAHIKSGLLYYDESGIPVYGLEIGQRSEIDGEEVFNKYARFTADKLSFFDQNGSEVAYISDRKLFITHVEVTGTFTQGGFVDSVLSDLSVVTKWIGGDG